jgi:hypothetical protein
VRVVNSGVAAEAAVRRHQVRCIAGDEDATFLKLLRDISRRTPPRVAIDLDFQIRFADRDANQLDQSPLADVRGCVRRSLRIHLGISEGVDREKAGLRRAVHPEKAAELGIASFRPEIVSIAMIAPSGMKSLSDCSRMRSSIPTERNISRVRMWKYAARGSGELAFSRSMVTERTPCWARNVAADRPTNPPPAINTGARCVTVGSL